MLAEFVTGFLVTGQFLLRIAGGVFAILVFLMATALILFVADVLFDLATEAIAKHWDRSGKQPKNWLGKIIMHRKRGKNDGQI